MKNITKINEKQLKNIISESVKKVLNEIDGSNYPAPSSRQQLAQQQAARQFRQLPQQQLAPNPNLPDPKQTDQMIDQLAPIRDTFKKFGYTDAANHIQQAINSVIQMKNNRAGGAVNYSSDFDIN